MLMNSIQPWIYLLLYSLPILLLPDVGKEALHRGQKPINDKGGKGETYDDRVTVIDQEFQDSRGIEAYELLSVQWSARMCQSNAQDHTSGVGATR